MNFLQTVGRYGEKIDGSLEGFGLDGAEAWLQARPRRSMQLTWDWLKARDG